MLDPVTPHARNRKDGIMAEKKKSSPKRAEARAASRRRGEKRHEKNREDNSERFHENLVTLKGVSPVILSSVRTTYGPTSAQPGKPKRPSKILRAVRRATDERVALRRAEHLHKS